MKIAPIVPGPTVRAAAPQTGGLAAPIAPIAPSGAEGLPWQNPAAASALRSTVQMLTTIEDGVIKAYSDVERVKLFAADLQMTSDILATATDALLNDGNKENDAFLPQLTLAGGGVTQAENRLSDKDIAATWPAERGDILGAIRKARVLAGNVADQVDPNGHAGS